MKVPLMDRTLVAKYNRPGPRYTSYPTALQFSPETPLTSLMADSARSTGPLSLYFHIPFCESLCYFCACAKEITVNRRKADTYLDYLERELDFFLRESPAGDRPVEQLHYGGGSPSFLTPAQVRRLTELWRSRFNITSDAELSVEIDPRTLTEEAVDAMAEAGFWRASFGVQDVNPVVQRLIHREQPTELNQRALGWLRAAGFRSVNVDLIYGLPGQTVESFRATLVEVLTYSPDRLAVFSYAHVPWVAPAQKILEAQSQLPGASTKLAMLEMIIETLTDAGYVYIGMDHFAKPDDELAVAQASGTLHRNFQGYSTRAGREIAAFGMSAISQTAGTYRQNEKSLGAYYAAINAGRLPVERGYMLTEDDRLRRFVIMELMCHGKLSYSALSQQLGIPFSEYFAAELASLAEFEADGLICCGPDALEVTATGWLLLRNIAMHFDRYLLTTAKRHAQTI